MPIQPGLRLGAYEVQEFVGRGAMGVVYRAFHDGLARPVAVKVLQALAPDAEATARFQREAQAIAQMRHPNILNVFDFGEYEGVPYMIVEYVPGGSLSDRLRGGGRLDPEAAVGLLRGVAAALDYAHSQSVVHRDVKPANVLLGPEDTPILADFGLAKLLSSATKSATGATTGTPAYMAPEQVKGSSVGPAADRYALATMAYELLTGAVPFEGAGVLELLYAHVYREPLPASQRQPGLGPAVDAVLMRGLSKDPAARWSSCAELVDALQRALKADAPPAPAGRPAASGLPASKPPGRLRSVSRRAGRSRWLVGLASAGLVVVVLLAALAVARAQRQPALTLSSSLVPAGDSVVITGTGLPPGQSGSVQLESTRREIGKFQADVTGGLRQDVRLPADAGEGDHLLLLCWNGGCPVSSVLHVTTRPRASPSATPARIFTPLINLSTVTPRLGGQLKVEGRGFDPGNEYSVSITQGAATHPFAGPAAAPGGAFSATATVPAALQPGPAEVVACIVTSGQPPKPADCARQQVTIGR